jgi:hypothetical protein
MAGLESTPQRPERTTKTKARAAQGTPVEFDQPPAVTEPGLGEAPAVQAQSAGAEDSSRELQAQERDERDDREAMAIGTENLDMPLAHGYSDAEWHAMVQHAAWLRAEQRGFQNGTPEQDWIEAEEELRRQIGGAR